jgi:glycosyltransferase involved in cell wall biosynthesis
VTLSTFFLTRAQTHEEAPRVTAHPLVSVVIPCFNAERFVGDAIKSALDQKYPRVEVVVVDDGSTDGTVDVLRSFGTHIRWITGPHRGAPTARNRAIAMAAGDVIQFLDADDVLDPNKLAVQVPILVHERVDSVWCDVRIGPLEQDDDASSIVRRPDVQDDAVVMSLGQNPGILSPIHTRAILGRIGGFRAELRCAQDRDLHLRAACAGGRIGYVRAVLASVRRRPASLSADFAKVLAEYERVVPPAYHGLVATGRMTEARSIAFAGFMARAARGCIRQGDHARASRYLETARTMHRGCGITAAYGSRLAPVRRLVGPWHAERAARCVQAVRRALPLSRRRAMHRCD